MFCIYFHIVYKKIKQLSNIIYCFYFTNFLTKY